MKKIAIFGGTFNPVHNGHINLCVQCDEVYHFDKILLIPTNMPPHKEISDLASNEDRMNMLQLATSEYEKIIPSDIEYTLGGKSYTIFTILELKKLYPDAVFYLIIGSDMLKTFNQWHCFEEILQEVTLICGARHENEFNELVKVKQDYKCLSDKIDIINISVIDISSTEIRKNIKNKFYPYDLLDSKVINYIKEKGLYLLEK